MKIAIFSDVHDNIWNLQAALASIQNCDVLLFCGDLCSPFIIPLMAQGFNKNIHIVFGNNDGDTYRITQNASKHSNVFLHGEIFKERLDGKSFVMNHFPDIAKELAKTGEFDVVCYGHDHLPYEKIIGKTLLLNPGALMGYNPKPGGDAPPAEVAPTFVIYNCENGTTIWYEVNTLTKFASDVSITNKPK